MTAHWTSGGKPASSRGATPILTTLAHAQLHRLDALIDAAMAARVDASRGLLFESMAGKMLTNTAHDLFECPELYDLAGTIGPDDREITREDLNEHEADRIQGWSAR